MTAERLASESRIVCGGRAGQAADLPPRLQRRRRRRPARGGAGGSGAFVDRPFGEMAGARVGVIHDGCRVMRSTSPRPTVQTIGGIHHVAFDTQLGGAPAFDRRGRRTPGRRELRRERAGRSTLGSTTSGRWASSGVRARRMSPGPSRSFDDTAWNTRRGAEGTALQEVFDRRSADRRLPDAVRVARRTVARIGAGASLGEVYEALHEHGLAIPAGTCPSVGIAGLTLGGGLGTRTEVRGDLRRLSGQRSSWPTAASSAATSTVTATFSGRCEARAPAPSAS